MSIVYYSIYESPIGSLFVAATDKGLCQLDFPGQYKSKWIDCLEKKYGACENKETALIALAKKELEEYFSGSRTAFTVPLDVIGTPFQNMVWNELTKVAYGTTATYGEIASRIGNPKAGRAVGGANNKNPVGIIVPCHRIVGSNGSLVGYAGGLDIKKKLLELENAIPKHV